VILNSLTGRRFPLTEYHPNKEEFEVLDPSLTIAVIIICMVGPFYLLRKFARQIMERDIGFHAKLIEKRKNLPESRLKKGDHPYFEAERSVPCHLVFIQSKWDLTPSMLSKEKV